MATENTENTKGKRTEQKLRIPFGDLGGIPLYFPSVFSVFSVANREI